MAGNYVRSEERVVPDITSRTLTEVNYMGRIDPGRSYQGVLVQWTAEV